MLTKEHIRSAVMSGVINTSLYNGDLIFTIKDDSMGFTPWFVLKKGSNTIPVFDTETLTDLVFCQVSADRYLEHCLKAALNIAA